MSIYYQEGQRPEGAPFFARPLSEMFEPSREPRGKNYSGRNINYNPIIKAMCNMDEPLRDVPRLRMGNKTRYKHISLKKNGDRFINF